MSIPNVRAVNPLWRDGGARLSDVALISRMVAEAVNVAPESKLNVNYGFNRLRFPRPLR